MILRILGYNDTKGDFVWDQSLDKAVEIGLIDAPYKGKSNKMKYLQEDIWHL